MEASRLQNRRDSVKGKVIFDILKVSSSNLSKLISGVLIGLLLPRLIGVEDYGYYKTFTLYITYVGLFMLGIGDGIYLEFGGVDYSSLDKKAFRYYSSRFIVIQSFLAVVLFLGSLIFLKDDMRFILCAIAIYLLFNNISGYFQIISQVTSRFNELSIRNVLHSVLLTVSVFLLWIDIKYINSSAGYRQFTILYVFTTVLLTIWYIFTYQDIIVGNRIVREPKKILHFIRIGFPLTFANLCSSFILTLDRQFVNILFDTEIYAVYAFAYNMLALVTTATSAIATVIYPKLKQLSTEKLQEEYSNLVCIVLIVVFGLVIVYFPLSSFVSWFLPNYIDSIPIFRIIFPGLAVSSAVTIIMHNYYKTVGKSTLFFKKSFIILILSGVANYIAFYFFKTTMSISIASIVTLIIWYLFVESFFIKEYKIQWIKNFLYMVCNMGSFYFATMFENLLIGFVIYLISLIVFVFLFYRSRFTKYLYSK